MDSRRRNLILVGAMLLIAFVAIMLFRLTNGSTIDKGVRIPSIRGMEDAETHSDEFTASRNASRPGGTRISRISTPVAESRSGKVPLANSQAGRAGESTSNSRETTPSWWNMQSMEAEAKRRAAARQANGYVPATNIPEAEQEAEIRSMISQSRNDMRTLATGLESYMIDDNVYPSETTSTRGNLQHANAGGPIPTFLSLYPQGPATLTTPVAYITSYFNDPFANVPGDTFAYHTKEEGGATGWVLFSPGPDGRFDFEWELYSPLTPQPSPDLIPYLYDPTNGLLSSGDLIRFKQ